jgi:hypothetical protein
MAQKVASGAETGRPGARDSPDVPEKLFSREAVTFSCPGSRRPSFGR